MRNYWGEMISVDAVHEECSRVEDGKANLRFVFATFHNFNIISCTLSSCTQSFFLKLIHVFVLLISFYFKCYRRQLASCSSSLGRVHSMKELWQHQHSILVRDKNICYAHHKKTTTMDGCSEQQRSLKLLLLSHSLCSLK